MAKVQKKAVNKTQNRKPISSPFTIYWSNTNYFIFGIGIVLLIVGFYLLSIDPWDSSVSLYAAPIILFVAYVLIFPASILFKGKTTVENQQAVKEQQ